MFDGPWTYRKARGAVQTTTEIAKWRAPDLKRSKSPRGTGICVSIGTYTTQHAHCRANLCGLRLPGIKIQRIVPFAIKHFNALACYARRKNIRTTETLLRNNCTIIVFNTFKLKLSMVAPLYYKISTFVPNYHVFFQNRQ